MAIFKILRKDEYNNKFRPIKIFVDGENIGTIANGETKDFNVHSGRHSIIAKIDWCSSSELSFDIKDNETKTFSLGGFKDDGNFWTRLYFLTSGRKKYLTLEKL